MSGISVRLRADNGLSMRRIRSIFGGLPNGVVLILITALVALYPLFANQYYVLLATLVGIYTLASFGLTILTGHTGMYNLGYAGLVALGAYSYVVLTTRGVSLVSAYLGVLAVGLLTGLLIGFAGSWLGEFSFAIVSFAATVFVVAIVQWAKGLTGGLQGIVVPQTPRMQAYYTTWSLVAVAGVALAILLRGWVGRSLRAVRDDETAAEMFGLPVAKVKFLAVLCTSMLPVLAGAGYAQAVGYVTPSTFTIDLSLAFLIIVVIGGLRSLWGALLGSALWVAVPELTTGLTGSYKIIFGALTILILLWQPRGLVGAISAIPGLVRYLPGKRRADRPAQQVGESARIH